MIDQRHAAKIAEHLQLKIHQVNAAGELLDGGATIPFIARYRKEATGALDEVIVASIRDSLDAIRELDKRRESILGALEESGKLSELPKSSPSSKISTFLTGRSGAPGRLWQGKRVWSPWRRGSSLRSRSLSGRRRSHLSQRIKE
jgi:hypothetical protein